MDILEKLFGSVARVKMMKLFLLNGTNIFDREDIIKRSKANRSQVGKEIILLEKIGFIRKRSFFKEKVDGRTNKTSKRRSSGYALDPSFPYLHQLKSLLVHSEPITDSSIIKRLSRYGNIKFVVTAGIFIQDEDSRLDLLVVGDKLKTGHLQNVISVMESEIGTELRYSIMKTSDFKYRISICDRLIRDVLDYPHQVVVDKFGISK